MTIRLLITLAASFLLTHALAAQTRNSEHTLRLDEGASSPKAEIEEMAWLAGYWRGEGLGGVTEEIWGTPLGDRMMGSFALSKNDTLVFSEAMMLVEEAGSLIFKLKHFNADFSGWEEKDDFVQFPLVRLGDREAFFSGLTVKRDGETLRAFVVVGGGGDPKELVFTFTRTDWP